MPHNQNQLLHSLSPSDLALLLPHLKPAYFKLRDVLFEAGDAVHTSYFPLTSIISLVVGLVDGETVEAAMVGRDGVVSASAALDGKISLTKGVVQLSGDMMMCDASALKTAAMQSGTLLSLLIRHEQTLFAQASQSTACMANHDVQSRLCRWLLRARDLGGTDTLVFTQEYLAEMLGVRRTSVTQVALTLQQAGMLKYRRGKIQLLDIEALQDSTCECYAAVKGHQEDLLGHNRRPSG